MQFKNLISIIFLASILVGCNTTEQGQESPDVNLTKVTNQKEINLDLSNRVKEFLSKEENISSVHAVNSNNLLVVAIDIPQMKRFNLQDIKNNIKKKLQKKFEASEVYVTTDQKIILELDQLEQKINQSSLTQKKLTKELKRIIKLMNEQT